jgi:hypothetical protein
MDLFISYRREDTAGHALLLKDALLRELPESSIFLDVDSIPGGVNFVDHVARQLTKADAVLIVIGDEWLRTRDGRQRLHDADDHVRTEIRQALDADVKILPILVERALMPRVAELPEDICRLAQMNAVEIHDRSWQQDLKRVIEALSPRAERPPPRNGDPRPGLASVPQRVTELWLDEHVPRLGRSELLALLEELRQRGWYEKNVESVTKRSRHRPPKDLPARATQAWIEEVVPLMSAYQLRGLIKNLSKRNWLPEEIRTRVMPAAAARPREKLPNKITMAFLEEGAIFLPTEQAQELAAVMRRRGWTEADVAEYVPRAD